jgi:hypothetical protein
MERERKRKIEGEMLKHLLGSLLPHYQTLSKYEKELKRKERVTYAEKAS